MANSRHIALQQYHYKIRSHNNLSGGSPRVDFGANEGRIDLNDNNRNMQITAASRDDIQTRLRM